MDSAASQAEALLQRAKHDDPHALGELFELYRRYLRLLARVHLNRQLQGKVNPSDLVQECFLQAQRDFPDFRGDTEAELVTWLRQILATKMAKMVRRYLHAQKRNVRLEQQMADAFNQSSQALEKVLLDKRSSPSQQASRREEAVLLAEALEQLPEDYREVLILRHLQGLKFTDIAEQMGRTLASVEKLWARALARLKKTLRGTT